MLGLVGEVLTGLHVVAQVDLRAIEVTIQNLIGSGMNPKTENNPYLGFVYTSFQERATKVRSPWLAVAVRWLAPMHAAGC